MFRRQVENGKIPELLGDSRLDLLEETVSWLAGLILKLHADLNDVIDRIQQLEGTEGVP